MKSFYLITAVSLFISSKSDAQLKGFSIGPYAEMIWPVGSLEKTNNNGIGGGLNADIRIGKFGITGSAGFIHFAGKTIADNEGTTKMPSIDAIPVRAGIKYRFIPALYIKLEGGVARFTGDRGSALIFSPGVGLRVLGLDVQGKYEAWINEGSGWGAKISYNF